MEENIKKLEVVLPQSDGGLSVRDSVELKRLCEAGIKEIINFFEEQTDLKVTQMSYYNHAGHEIPKDHRVQITVYVPEFSGVPLAKK